jgi:polysaccharide deacetylase family protein (PEP-CTERM system associated)
MEDRVAIGTELLLDLLATTGNTATFFVLGAVADSHPELVRRILADGHEVGSHGHEHLSLKSIQPWEFERDLDASLEALARAGASEVVSYRAPYFSLDTKTLWSIPTLLKAGIRNDSSIFPLMTGYYGDKRMPNHPVRLGELREYPITLPEFRGWRVPITGGFYCRLFPASWTVRGIRSILLAGNLPVFYIHPWELDPDQPRFEPSSRFLGFRHYLRLDSTIATLERILSECSWGSIAEIAGTSSA